MGLTLAGVLAVVYRGRADRALRAVGRWGLVSAHIYALNMISFVYSINNTAVANTLVIIAAAPLFAAILSRVFLGEGVRLETWAATLVVLAGIAIVFWDGLAQGTWDGDLAALVTALCLAGNFTILRHRKHIDMVPATALGGFIAAVLLLVIGAASPLAPDGRDWLVLAVLGCRRGAGRLRADHDRPALHHRTRGRAVDAGGDGAGAALGLARAGRAGERAVAHRRRGRAGDAGGLLHLAPARAAQRCSGGVKRLIYDIWGRSTGDIPI